MTPEQYADGERDALAVAACFVRRDLDALSAIERNGEADAVITALLNLLFAALHDGGIDPAAWIARRQERLRQQGGR